MEQIDLENSKYSQGTTPVYNGLMSEVIQRHAPAEVVMINVGTMLRNCAQTEKIANAVKAEERRGIETDQPSKMLLSDTKREITMFLNDIVQMFDNARSTLNPTIIAYFCDYSKCIPAQYYRVPTHGKRVTTVAESLLRSVMQPKRTVSQVRNITLIEVPILNGEFPHHVLDTELGFIKNNHRIVHVTNHPVDMHICRSTSHYRLIQSFTGNVLTPDDLARKTFDTDDLPFNVYLHAVLGDKYDIKPSLKPGEKKRMMEIARQEHWKIHTGEWIKKRLLDLNVRVPFNI